MSNNLKHVETYDGKTWSNTIRNHQVQPRKYYLPKSKEEIVNIIRAAEHEGLRVRAVGSGHSFSSCAITEDYMLDLRRMQLVEDHGIQKGEVHPTVYLQAGTTIKKLNKELSKFRYSILNMGGIDHQTIAGAISTGTHGTGYRVPAMHGSVRAIQLIGENGKLVQLEPEDGFLHPSGESVNGFTVRHNDEEFEAALVSFGSMGIIYAYYFEVRAEYWLKESKTLKSWSWVRQQLGERSILDESRGLMVQVNPYAGLDKKYPKDHTCLLVKHMETDTIDNLTHAQRARNFLSIVAANIPILRWIFYWLLVIMLNIRRKSAPNLLQRAICVQKDPSYINRAHKVLYQGAEFAKERAYDCEVAFDTADNHYLHVIDLLLEQAASLAQRGIYHSSPIGLRFVAPSNAMAAPDYHRTVCYIDTPMLLRGPHHQEIVTKCLNLMVREGGSPHWGKFIAPIFTSKKPLEDIYPGLGKWKKVIREFTTKSTFSNAFVEKVLASKTHHMA